MNPVLKIVARVLVLSLLGGFALSGESQAMSSKKADAVSSAGSSVSTTESVWVQKSDGGKSCEGGASELEVGAEALKKAGIEVFESKKGNDGKMHAQMCGAPTGGLLLYRIAAKDLSTAQSLGFAPSTDAKNKK